MGPGSLVQSFAAKLRFPQLFLVTLGLFVFDLFVPDFVPLIDEVLLGLTTVLLGSWRKNEPEKPPMKDVTPPRDG